MAERILNRLVEAVISLNESCSEASNAPKMNQAINENKTEAREAALRQLFQSILGQSLRRLRQYLRVGSRMVYSIQVQTGPGKGKSVETRRGHRAFVDPVVYVKQF